MKSISVHIYLDTCSNGTDKKRRIVPPAARIPELSLSNIHLPAKKTIRANAKLLISVDDVCYPIPAIFPIASSKDNSGGHCIKGLGYPKYSKPSPLRRLWAAYIYAAES